MCSRKKLGLLNCTYNCGHYDIIHTPGMRQYEVSAKETVMMRRSLRPLSSFINASVFLKTSPSGVSWFSCSCYPQIIGIPRFSRHLTRLNTHVSSLKLNNVNSYGLPTVPKAARPVTTVNN